MSLVFNYGPFRAVDEARHPGLGAARFASVDSFIATKAAALLVNKRPRDAFDIFVSIVDSPELIGHRWRTLQQSDGMFREAADTIRKAVLEGDAVEKTVNALPPGRHPPEFVRDVFLRFVGTGEELPARPRAVHP